ncbi:MAG: metal ABC transporter substrate-binding protein [Candidatus Eremiobacteraeota bacterium]|nr:metal ABC transporter substrate-binding protein [Candidatus Eremiobacteraeota bacterium]
MILASGKHGFCIAFAILALGACSAQSAPHARPLAAAAPGTKVVSPNVVVTTSTIAALASSVAGSRIQIHTLVPLGASPETYEPTPRDIVMLERTDLLIENGAGLEAWLRKIIASARSSHMSVLVLSTGLTVAASTNAPGAASPSGYANPHLWLDPVFAQAYVRRISAALVRLDPAGAAIYRHNASAELQRLRALDVWIRSRMATVPPANRVMITFHDAWFYFDRRYGIVDLGSVVTAPGREPSAADFAALIAKAKANRVRAIFGEPEYSPKLVEQLASSAHIRIVANLYDDSLGQSPQLSSYEGMLRYDVDTIVQALRNG